MNRPTKRQLQVLDFINGYISSHGNAPSQREIAASLGINGTLGVMKHLQALEKKGCIVRRQGSARGVTLPPPSSTSVSLPIVGTLRAGQPDLPLEDIEGYFSIDSSQQRDEQGFFLRVKGDSMIGAGILEGDLALIRPQATAEKGDIVVAMVDGEATMKRFFRERGKIRLQPENPTMEPLIINPGKQEITIIGRVTGIYRKL
jgi:repressor LexA